MRPKRKPNLRILGMHGGCLPHRWTKNHSSCIAVMVFTNARLQRRKRQGLEYRQIRIRCYCRQRSDGLRQRWPPFYAYLIESNRNFIIRLKGRSVISWKGMHYVHDLARECIMRHSHHVTFDSHGTECNVPISFGAMPIRLPMHPDKELHLVVVKGAFTRFGNWIRTFARANTLDASTTGAPMLPGFAEVFEVDYR